MSKTILADVDGFTPLIDSLAKELGMTTAAVFGRVWRFCQMKDGVCQASLETISDGLGIDRSTVLRHIETLCSKGYLYDRTPDLRNRPHTYADTGKAGIRVKIEAGGTVAQRNTDNQTVAPGNTTVAQRNTNVAERNVTVAENQLKIVSKIDQRQELEEIAPPIPLPQPDDSVTDQYNRFFMQAINELRMQVPRQVVNYLDDVHLVAVNGAWFARVPHRTYTWFTSRMVDGSLNRILKALTGQPVQVKFVLEHFDEPK